VAILKKTLFPENIDKYSVLIQDTDPNSKYFKITELPDTFTGGKNAFLIQGSSLLVADTIVKIEIKDALGNIIYHEPGEGIPEYYEGTSKVIAVYVYPDTAFGPCTITILGEITEYLDTNGVLRPVPIEYRDTYNVRWQKQINVNPFLANDTKIRFYRRPQAEITEVLKPVFTVTETYIQQGGTAQLFGNQVDDLLIRGRFLPDNFEYRVKLIDNSTFKSSMLGTTMSFASFPTYKPEIVELVSSTEAKLDTPLLEESVIQTVLSTPYQITFLSGSDRAQSQFTSSYAQIKLTQLETFAGDVKRVKVFRKSKGSISDFELVQDILLESTELLKTLDGTNKAVESTGIFNSEILSQFWIVTDSLTKTLSNSRLVNGVKLNGAGKFKYSSSLDLSARTVYELQFDAFYSSSTKSNLEIYISGSTTTNSSSIGETLIGTLNGLIPTTKYENQKFEFSLPFNEPSASLFFSASQSEWHLSDLSLVVSNETAFSPDSVTFLTSVPTSIPQEIFEFKFEFYDVNNNFVPVSVLEEKQFVGGTNTVIVLTQLASSSVELSGSISSASINLTNTINSVSTSISGTVTTNSASAFTTITNVSSSISGSIISLSGSVSGSINTLSGSVSGSINTLSGSVSGSITSLSSSVSGSIGILSGSVSGSIFTLSGSVSSSIANVSSSISSSIGTANSQSLFSVLSASAFLDRFIFTDVNGKLRRPPTASVSGLYIGNDHLGFYSGSGWKTYMDDQGDFYLTSSISGGGFLAWSSILGRLQIQGDINIQGGNAATTASLNSATSSLLNSINSATQSLSSSLYNSIFTNQSGQINKPPTVLVGSPSGLYLGSTFMGYYDGTDWRTYMDNQGDFYLTSSLDAGFLIWDSSAATLTIRGAITVTGGNAATNTNLSSSLTNAISSGSVSATAAQTAAQLFATSIGNNAVSSGSTAASNAVTSGSAAAANAAASASISASAAQTAAINQAKSDASASVNLLANGGWVGGSGTFITATSISSPVIAANGGYISGIFRVGENGITLDGGNKKIFVGNGSYSNSNTPFYFASASSDIFSLGNKLSWDGTTLTVNGSITVTGGNAATNTNLSSSLTNAVTSGSVSATAAQTAAQLFATSIGNNAVTSGSTAAANAVTSGSTAASNAVTSGSTAAANAAASASAAQTAAINQAKSDASASINLLANGNWTAGNGTFITSTSISSPIIAGNAGFISGIFVVGNGGAITLDGINKKIYIGTGTHNNTNTSFYVDNAGKFSLKDKLVWDGTTLSITGNITVSGGNAATTSDVSTVSTAAANAQSTANTAVSNAATAQTTANNASTAATNAQNTANTKITTGGAAADVNSNVTTISGGKIRTGTIESTGFTYTSGDFSTTGTQINLDNGLIRSKNFLIDSSGNAKFQGNVIASEGTIGGWTLQPLALTKTTGSFTIRLNSEPTNIGLVVRESNNVDSLDRVRINADLTIPAITLADTQSLTYSNNNQTIFEVYDTDSPPNNNTDITQTATQGVVTSITYAKEEVFVEPENFPNLGTLFTGDCSNGDALVQFFMKAIRYPSEADANNNTNGTVVGQVLVASAYREISGGTAEDTNRVYGGTIQLTGPGGINTQTSPVTATFYRIQLIISAEARNDDGGGQSSVLRVRRPSSDVTFKYGRVGNGYSIFSPGGIQVYQGIRNYINAADITKKAAFEDVEEVSVEAGAVDFFEVKGKSKFIGTITATQGLSVPKGKQFKIVHPLDENMYLYHTAIEAPRADLIYRGILELQSGFASCSIDSSSRMKTGTFNALTKNPQIFLQNETSFDRLKGKLVSGSLEIYCENNQSIDTVSWMVVAERNDKDMRESPLYDMYGRYNTERYSDNYIRKRKKLFIDLRSGSV